MYFGLLLVIGGLFLIIWGLHYFGLLVAVGGSADAQQTSLQQQSNSTPNPYG